jgi:hypothetical protein
LGRRPIWLLKVVLGYNSVGAKRLGGVGLSVRDLQDQDLEHSQRGCRLRQRPGPDDLTSNTEAIGAGNIVIHKS